MINNPTTKSWGVVLRYPILFGSILVAMGVGFLNRDKFLTDLPEMRNKMQNEDLASRKTIDEFIKQKQKEDFKI